MNEGKPPSYSILVDNLSASNVVVFDVETTGLDVKYDDIIQIAAVRLDAEGNHKEKFVRYLQASKSVGDSVEVHHITDEKLRQVGETPVTVLTQFWTLPGTVLSSDIMSGMIWIYLKIN